ncbi:MAG: amidohydrolase [Clostridia bacterium]|nr:amidohydrolase [Clostridia bacterium]
MNYIITNASIWSNALDAEVEPGEVHVKDGIISYVGPEKEPDFVPDRTIDADGDLVMPSFFNGHTHLGQTILRGYAEDVDMEGWLEKIRPAETKFTDEMYYWSTLLGMCEMVRSGTTAFNEMHPRVRPIARAAQQSGMRCLLARSITSRMGAAGEAERKVREAEDFFLEWNDGADGRVKVFFGPHSYYNNMEPVIQQLGELAKKYNTGIHTHLSETFEGHRQCIRETGMTPSAFYSSMGLMDVPFVAAHGVYMTEHDALIFAAQGACLAVCARSNLKLRTGIPPLGRFQRHKVPVALGTDSAAANNRLSILSEMDTVSLVQHADLGDQADYSPKDLLRMACITGRATAGVRSGQLMEGWNADLIIVDTKGVRWRPNWDNLTTLIASAQDRSVRLTMCAGKILYEDDVIQFCDEEEVLAKAIECRNRLTS